MAAAAAAAASSPSSTFSVRSPIQPKPHRLVPSSSSSSSICFPRPFSSFIPSPLSISNAHDSHSLFLRPTGRRPLSRTLALVEEEEATAPVDSTNAESAEEDNGDSTQEPTTAESAEDGNGDSAQKPKVRPCQLYICNIPRSCDIAELFELFKLYGTVQSVEISRNSETGTSRGCGFVTMSSVPEAKAAIAALDGSDLGGREVRVRFSADMFPKRKNALNSAPKEIIVETPYKAYIGNLRWSVKREDLTDHFSQFGSVVGARILFDRRGGKGRVYGFVSFSSAEELEAAKSSNGIEFHGRKMLVRDAARKEQEMLS